MPNLNNKEGRTVEVRTNWPNKGTSTVRMVAEPTSKSVILPELRTDEPQVFACKRRHDFKNSKGEVDEAAWAKYKKSERCVGCRQLALELYNHHTYHTPKPKVTYVKACIKRTLAERKANEVTLGHFMSGAINW